MGAKHDLRELIGHMSDAEAAAWLEELRAPRRPRSNGHRELIDEVIASLPPEAFDDWPPSNAVDEVVYGT